MKVFIDTSNMFHITIANLNNLIDAGCELCFTNTVVDIKVIRDNPEWFETQLMAGKAFIECWTSEPGMSPADSLDEMVSKPFYWSSFEDETPRCLCFEEVYHYLPSKDDRKAVDRIAALVISDGKPKGEWPMGQWSKPILLDEEADILGVDPMFATRSEIFVAARKTNAWEVYSRYNSGYLAGLARQHCCQGILNPDGTITVVPPNK